MQGTPPGTPPAAPPAPAAGDSPLSVSQFARRIDAAVRTATPASLRVVGEVSGFSDRSHWYFSLKDEGAVVQCVMWASAAKKLGFTPAQGQQVICRGRLEFYAPGGRVSFVVDKIEPVGEGAREAALRRLVEEARALGWLDPARKRPLPPFPRRLAVITSEAGAALQDVIVTMKRRCPSVGLLILDARVQGDRAAPEVTQAIRYLSTHAAALRIDAILVTRGGGSAEDLWAFNDREMARAIVECSVPLVAAIGHETDTSLAELVADERAATPTQAAMRLAPDAAGLARQFDSLIGRLGGATAATHREAASRLASARRAVLAAQRAGLSQSRRHLADLSERLSRRSPAAINARTLSRIDAARRRLDAALRDRLDDPAPAQLLHRVERAVTVTHRESIARAAATTARLESISPIAVLQRGYSVTLSPDGRPVTSPDAAPPGTQLCTRLRDGSISSVVTSTDGQGVVAPARTAPPKPPRKPKPTDAPGLFGA